MAINWPNLSPKQKPFTIKAGSPTYSPVPNFSQDFGVRPGMTPVIGHTAKPFPTTPETAFANLPGIFKLTTHL